ncbi:hypothetical protein Rumeso_02829 [Rubellimicrobium mesophilum DSM 19309]|uniref:Uncharacterized protein n=1 Tax=Rubellimicrobium mesophilum DSM 19309 TaxID=442562 RepID=A0A017HNA0_9RHOB|nr:hypothetical protein Rumeso_02829 [Rubellimicrobium mesophilum DSM 19309]
MEDLCRLLRSGHVQAQGINGTLDAPALACDVLLPLADVPPDHLDVGLARVRHGPKHSNRESRPRQRSGLREGAEACRPQASGSGWLT